ncbi:MAG: hypothetical protein RLZZ26_152 [Candidatus Parcubacteria bacterium]
MTTTTSCVARVIAHAIAITSHHEVRLDFVSGIFVWQLTAHRTDFFEESFALLR